jgi:hypothetical protein
LPEIEGGNKVRDRALEERGEIVQNLLQIIMVDRKIAGFRNGKL